MGERREGTHHVPLCSAPSNRVPAYRETDNIWAMSSSDGSDVMQTLCAPPHPSLPPSHTPLLAHTLAPSLDTTCTTERASLCAGWGHTRYTVSFRPDAALASSVSWRERRDDQRAGEVVDATAAWTGVWASDTHTSNWVLFQTTSL